MKVWLAILITCTAPDACEISDGGDPVLIWSTEADCQAFAQGLKLGAVLTDGFDGPASYALDAVCLELSGFFTSPSDPPA